MRLPLILLAVTGLALAQPASLSYIGAGGCASSNCHGAAAPLAPADSRILGNEYATWTTADKHARAYRVLTEPRGKRMAEILRIADAAHDKRCAPCHVAGSPEKSLSDGVACEGCHGGAEKWLGTHTRQNSHEASVKAGMIDTRNLEVRAKTCLACHLGTANQSVDHELVAAGHPDLAFELDTFTAAQPSHRRPAAAPMRIRAWAVGQTVALAESMRLVAAHAARNWPEFADLECYQCHHDLRAESWRIARGYGTRRPGSPQLDTARLEIVRELVSVAAPDQRPAFEGELSRLTGNVMEGSAVGQAAKAVERLADTLTERFQKQDVDAAAVLRSLCANIRRIADAGVGAAEQATMTLDALGAALGRNPDVTAPLYNYLEHPSVYRPEEFASLFLKAAT